MQQLIPPLSLSAAPPKDPFDYVVDQFLPHAYLAILAGEPKCGKTAFATALAMAIATGSPFLGHKTHQGPVLWLSLEESPDERAAIFKHVPEALRKSIHESPQEGMEPGKLPIYTIYEHRPIDDQFGLWSLDGTLNAIKPKLVVVDSLHASHSGRSLTDGWAARKTLKGLKRYSGPKAPAILVLHHIGGTRYRRRVAESAQLAATASLLWLMEELPSPEGSRCYAIESRGRGDFANRRLLIHSPSPLEYERMEPEGVAEPNLGIAAPQRAETLILDGLEEGPLTSVELIERTGLSASGVRNALTRLRTAGKVRVVAFKSGCRKYNKVAVNKRDSEDSKDSATCIRAPSPVSGATGEGRGGGKRPAPNPPSPGSPRPAPTSSSK